MDWFILICLVPLTIIPVVLLGGFAGCSSFSADDVPLPDVPTNLQVKSLGPLSVVLTWQHTPPNMASFKVLRAKSGDTATQIDTTLASELFYTDSNQKPGLVEGTNFIYEVSASSNGSDSAPSPPATVTTLPNTPIGLAATPVDGNVLLLSWKNNSKTANRFKLEHRSPANSGAYASIYAGVNLSFPHTLPPAVGSDTHEYRVSSILNGWNNVDVFSLPSVAIQPARPVWLTAFGPAGLNDNDGTNINNHTLVQKINSILLSHGGNKVRLTLRGATNGTTVITQVSLSQVAKLGAVGNPTPHAWDSGDDIKTLLASGASVTLNQNLLTLNVVDYKLDPSQDLLVSFDIGTGHAVRKAMTGPTFYNSNNKVTEAGTERRTDYNTKMNFVYFVEQIEVL